MTDETIEIIGSFPIYKPFRKKNLGFKGKLNNILGKMNRWIFPKYKPNIEELNQFIFCSTLTEDDKYQEVKHRHNIENKLTNVFEEFSTDILNQIQEVVEDDPELQTSLKAFKDANKQLSRDFSSSITKLQSLSNVVTNEVQSIFYDSSMILWDMPGNEIDRIILGSKIIDMNSTLLRGIDIGVIADELALAALGRHHVPLIVEQISAIQKVTEELVPTIQQFDQRFLSISSKKSRDIMIEVASVFLGKLLGIREPLIMAEKQLERYLQLEADMKEEANEMQSSLLPDLYEDLIDDDSINQALDYITQIMDKLTENSERIRKLYTKIEDLEITQDSNNHDEYFVDFCEYVINVYYDLENFRFTTELFLDIPSYTSMGGGVIIQEEEDEIEDIPSDSAIYAKHVFKTFPLLNSTVYALRGIDLNIKQGEFVAIMGPSGSGKTTLLNILSGLDTADRGTVVVDGLDLNEASEGELVKFRRDSISFVYQTYNLLPNLTNEENVRLPAELGTSKELGDYSERAVQLLDDVGLKDYKNGMPLRLSGGQQQRVTISRALMNKPSIIFADEPTGDLDAETGSNIMDVLDRYHDEGVTIVLVTHDQNIAKRAERIISVRDGQVVDNLEEI